MKFTEYIEKTLEQEKGYQWGRGWRTNFDGEKKILTLIHYGTEILKLEYTRFYAPKEIKVIYFRLGSVSDNQGINRCLPAGMWAGSWWGRWGHFIKKINGVDINTADCIVDNNKPEYLCKANDKIIYCKKLPTQIKFKSGKFFHIGNYKDNVIIKVISKYKRPFYYKRSMTLWRCKTMKNIFPIASSLCGSEVYKCVHLKTEEAPEWFVNKCVARVV